MILKNRTPAVSRRTFLRNGARTAAAIGTAPLIVPSTVFGANDKITFAGIGMGGRGTGDLRGFLNFDEIRTLAVCDVVKSHAARAQQAVNEKYGTADCSAYTDYQDIIARDDIDAILIGTPDHWHAKISCEAMASGKDVFCEKPETLTINEGKEMRATVERYGSVFSGGSQRVWGDYNWFHRMIYSGEIGEVKEAFVNVGGPSAECHLPSVDIPADVDWDRWLGPAPWRPFHPDLLRGRYRPYRDYSGGGMTDWGCHGFGGAMFACNVHYTGPTEIIPPDGSDVPNLTYVFANGLKMYHGGGWGGILSFRGTEGEIPVSKDRRNRPQPGNIHIPNYKGRRGILGDFIHCVKTREKPFRNIEVAHRTATLCHLGNIAYWLNRPLKWDPVAEQMVGDPEAARWMDRAQREPYTLG